MLIKKIAAKLCCIARRDWRLDCWIRVGVTAKVECFSLFERYVTLRHFRSVHGRVHLINLFAVSTTGCCVPRSLTTSSFGGKETNFFGSKFAIDSSTPLSKGLLLLYLTVQEHAKSEVLMMSVLSRPAQKEVSKLHKRTDHCKALDRRRFERDCPCPRPDQRRFVVCSPRWWCELRGLPCCYYCLRVQNFAILGLRRFCGY